jgi:hypothetical protein
VLYGLGFSQAGPGVTMMVAATVILIVGVVCARLLRERAAA